MNADRDKAPLDEWFPGFVRWHIGEVHKSNHWPAFDPGNMDGFWLAWHFNFRRRGITRSVAFEASLRMAGDRQHHPAEQLAVFLKTAKDVFRERGIEERADPAPDDRETAELQSKGCPNCGGAGITAKWRKKSIDEHIGANRAVAFYCLCPMGRWTEHNHRTKAPEVRRRMLDLMDHPWLHHSYDHNPAAHVPEDAQDAQDTKAF